MVILVVTLAGFLLVSYFTTVIAEIFVRVKISYSGVCQLSYARIFRTATVVSDTHAYVYGFRMLLNFVLSAKSTKCTKLNRVRKFVRSQYSLRGKLFTSKKNPVVLRLVQLMFLLGCSHRVLLSSAIADLHIFQQSSTNVIVELCTVIAQIFVRDLISYISYF